jgi:hypothetical protein
MSYNNDIIPLKTCTLLPESGEVVIGHEKTGNDSLVFNYNSWLETAAAFRDNGTQDNHDETVVAGFAPQYHDAVLKMDRIRNETGKSKEQKKAMYAGIIRPEFYSDIQMAAANVAVYRPTIRQHGLLQTVLTRTVNDLNGIEFLTIDPIDQHVVNEDLKFANIPYEVSNFGLSSTTMNVKRFGYAYAVSEELRLTRFKLDIESEILGQLGGVLDLHKNEWIATLLNGISATARSNWTTITSGAFAMHALDDLTYGLDTINGQNQSPPANLYSTKAVLDAYLYNVGATAPPGVQQILRRPYSYGNGSATQVPLVDGLTWTYDDLLTTNRLIFTSADAITHLQGPQKIVNFTNRDQSEFGTMVKAYYNIEITRPTLIKAISGIIA